ncbi:MAG: TAXI family TRAP transporter solute-binding subunit [bacterium]
MIKKTVIMVLSIVWVLSVLVQCSKKSFVSIGTGAVTGVFYPTGGAICRMINQKADIYNIKATVESTAGSVYNINAVLSGDLEFGIAQSDRQYQAVHGLAEWKDQGPQTSLRSVFAIHPEAVNLVVSVKSGIRTVEDLREKRINLGNPGSGPLQNSRDVLKAFGLAEEDLNAEYIKAVEAPGLLQDERIDGFFYTVGHPNGNIKEATAGRIPVYLVPINGISAERLIQAKPYYTRTTVSRDLYPKAANQKDVVTLGVRATLVTSANVDENIVYAITKEIFDNFARFKTFHPAFRDLTKQDMLTGLSAPPHPGAYRYFREAGLVEHIPEELIPE